MKKILNSIIAIVMIISIFSVNNLSVYANNQVADADETQIVLLYETNDVVIKITEEKVNDGILYNEYHNNVLVDTLYVEDNVQEGTTQIQLNNDYANINANPNINGTTNLGKVYFNVSGFTRTIQMDLRYKSVGAPSPSTYTLRNRYVTLLALASDLAIALFFPQVFAMVYAQKLLEWGVAVVVSAGFEIIGTRTLICSAQEEYFYAYTPLQLPDQPEVSKMFNGTYYIISTQGYDGEIYFSGYSSKGFGTTELGVNLGNSFFSSYNSVVRWERAS